MEDAEMMEGAPAEGPQMAPEEAMAVLQQFKIPMEAVPQIMAACETLEYANSGGQQSPAQQPPKQSLMQALSGRYSEQK